MAKGGDRFLGAFTTFAGLALVTAILVAALGYYPTVAISGREAIWSMLAGCGVSLAASWIGAIPLALAASGKPREAVNAVLLSTAVRFVTVLVLVVPLVFSGWLVRGVLVLWVGISYLLMLFVDTAFAVHVINRASESDS